jgi:hypothetical protein
MLVVIFLISALLCVYPLTAWDWRSFATMSAISISPILIVWTFYFVTDAGATMFYGFLLLGSLAVVSAIAGRLITLSLQSAFAWPRYLSFPLEAVPALSLPYWSGLWTLG